MSEAEGSEDAASERREVVSDRGQRLVEVPPAERRPRGRPRGSKNNRQTRHYESIDDVVRQQAERDRARAVEDDESPAEVHTPDDDVPPAMSDPARRDRATYGEVKVRGEEEFDPEVYAPPPVKPHKPRTLDDLCAMFDFDGSGQFYISVIRQKPPTFQHLQTSGRMQNIKDSLTHDDFVMLYGGGQYQLIVYGPHPRVSTIDPSTQQPKKVALTEPVTVTIPWLGENAIHPNIYASADMMRAAPNPMHGASDGSVVASLLGRPMNTHADAKIAEVTTNKELEMDARNREERREERTVQREAERTAAELVQQSGERAMELLKQQLTETQRELREARSTKQNGHTDITALVTALAGSRGSADELERMKSSYESQLEALRQSYETRLKDAEVRHRSQIEDRDRVLAREREDLSRRADEQVRVANDRLAQVTTQSTADRDRDRQDHQREMDRLRTDHGRDTERIIADHRREMDRQKEQYETRIQVMERDHQRDREQVKETLTLRGDVQKSSVESDLRTANLRVTELTAEVARLREELSKKSNLPKMLKEYGDTAEALGYSKEAAGGGEAEEPSLKDLFMKGGLELIKNLPETVHAVGGLIAQQRGGAAPQQMPAAGFASAPRQHVAQVAASPMHVIVPTQGFSTEEAPHNPGYAFANAELPRPAMPPEPAVQPQQQQPQQQQPQQQQPQQQQPQPAAPAPAPRERRAARRAEAPVTEPTASPAAPNPAPTLTDAQIVQFSPELEKMVEAGDFSPEEHADNALRQWPILKVYAEGLTPEYISEVLRRNNKGLSSLVQRKGQQFIKRFRARILGAPA